MKALSGVPSSIASRFVSIKSVYFLLMVVFAVLFIIEYNPAKTGATHNACGWGDTRFDIHEWCGYFTHEFATSNGDGLIEDFLYNGDYALMAVNNIDEFVGAIRHHLQLDDGYCSTVTTANPNRLQRRNSAAFVILTMLGAPAGTSPSTPCSSTGTYSFDAWETRVRDYDSNGLVNYNNYLNITHNGSYDLTYHDVYWFNANENDLSITFFTPGGTVAYSLQKICMNPTNGNNLPELSPPPAPVAVTCGNLITSPVEPEAGTSFRVRVSFNIGSGSGSDPDYNAYMTLPEAGLNDSVIGSGTAVLGSPLTVETPDISAPDPGQFEGSFRIEATDADPSSLTCNFGINHEIEGRPPVRVYNLPYMKVYGGDIHAGAGYESSTGSCQTSQDSGFIGYNRLDSGPFTGTGVQLAAMITGVAEGASSGQVRYSSDSKTLTLANDSSSHNTYGSTAFGGGLFAAGNAICAPDYFAKSVNASDTITSSTITADIPPGTYYRDGPLTITGGTIGIGSASKRTIYVKGDVLITGNIAFGAGSYESVNHIPVFRLIVLGNIQLSSGVARLDGIYVAQPDPANFNNTGKFYTCWPGGVPSANTMNGACRVWIPRLTINGAVIAKRVKLTRSAGTRAQATDTERYNNNEGAPAEVFVMPPEVWLTGKMGTDSKYDAIKTLPPVL